MPKRYIPQHFIFKGKRYRYFRHPYNSTWLNEREVEIALARKKLQEYRGHRILEVGNVTPHYFRSKYRQDVVDKYEPGQGVVNKDILEFTAKKPYDLIISISTIEHIGWDSIAMTKNSRPDREQRDSQKILQTIKHLRGLLAPGGELFLTAGIGYNNYLDRFLDQGKIPFSEVHYLAHEKDGRWQEAAWNQVQGTAYDYKHCRARAIVVGSLSKYSH